MTDARPRDSLAVLLTSLGLVCALALVPLAFVAPVYSGQSSSSGGVTSATHDTLIGINGYSVLVPICVPLLLALLCWLGLHLRCARGSRVGTALGWSSAWLLAAFAVVASASIGLYVLPAAMLLVLGASTTPDGSRASA
jgi:hypothetical protein